MSLRDSQRQAIIRILLKLARLPGELGTTETKFSNLSSDQKTLLKPVHALMGHFDGPTFREILDLDAPEYRAVTLSLLALGLPLKDLLRVREALAHYDVVT